MVGGQRGCTPPMGHRSTRGRGPEATRRRQGVEVAQKDHKWDWGRAMEEGRHGWSPLPEVQMRGRFDFSLLALGP